MMQVEQIMARPVHYCGPDDSLRHAAQLMWDHDCGWLPVCRGNGASQLVGVITDRDICMCAMFQDAAPGALRVAEAMAGQVRSCRPEDSLATAEKIMREARVRRLPVVDGEGVLLGMVSLADLAYEALRENTAAKHEITEREIGATLAAICAPTHREIAAA